jgi:hypothetical protein
MSTVTTAVPVDRTVQLVHYYTLASSSPLPAEVAASTPPPLRLGRFEKHTHQRGFPQLNLVASKVVSWSELAVDEVALVSAGTVDVQVWRANEYQLLLRLSHEQTGDVESICDQLGLLCHDRDRLTIENLPLASWVSQQLSPPAESVELAQDVVQFVILPRPTSSLPAPTLDERAKIIRRSFTYTSSNPLDAYKSPTELNRSTDQYAGHGRGVILLGGHADHYVDAIQLTALHLVLGVSRLRIMRADIKAHLKAARLGTQTQTLTELVSSSESIRQNLITMSVEVSDWFDGVWMPEIVLDGFRNSFTETLDAHALRDSTQQLLTSLSSVIETYRREFELRATKRSQQVQDNWHVFVAALSALVIPLAILISYFGVSSTKSAPPDDSIFSRPYLVPWICFGVATILIVGFALLLRRGSRAVEETEKA